MLPEWFYTAQSSFCYDEHFVRLKQLVVLLKTLDLLKSASPYLHNNNILCSRRPAKNERHLRAAAAPSGTGSGGVQMALPTLAPTSIDLRRRRPRTLTGWQVVRPCDVFRGATYQGPMHGCRASDDGVFVLLGRFSGRTSPGPRRTSRVWRHGSRWPRMSAPRSKSVADSRFVYQGPIKQRVARSTRSPPPPKYLLRFGGNAI